MTRRACVQHSFHGHKHQVGIHARRADRAMTPLTHLRTSKRVKPVHEARLAFGVVMCRCDDDVVLPRGAATPPVHAARKLRGRLSHSSLIHLFSKRDCMPDGDQGGHRRRSCRDRAQRRCIHRSQSNRRQRQSGLKLTSGPSNWCRRGWGRAWRTTRFAGRAPPCWFGAAGHRAPVAGHRRAATSKGQGKMSSPASRSGSSTWRRRPPVTGKGRSWLPPMFSLDKASDTLCSKYKASEPRFRGSVQFFTAPMRFRAHWCFIFPDFTTQSHYTAPAGDTLSMFVNKPSCIQQWAIELWNTLYWNEKVF